MQISATAAQSAYFFSSQQSRQVQQQEQISTTQTSRAKDTVEISSEGMKLLDMNIMTPDVSTGSINDQMEFDKNWVEDYLEKKLGVKSGENYSFKIGRDGHVNVSGGEKAERIEQAFENNTELRNRLARLSANSSLVRAAREHMEFAEAYERDPKQAVAMYSYLFNGSKSPDTVFEYGSNGLDVYFEGRNIVGKELFEF